MSSNSEQPIIHRPPLGSLVHDRLLAEIIGGVYSPGERLHLDSLAAAYGVSRTPIREALLSLSAIGFVDVAPNSRSLVANWSVANMIERMLVLGPLVANLSSRVPAGLMLSAASSSDREPEIRYLDLAMTVMEQSIPLAATYLGQSIIAPLRLFLATDSLRGPGRLGSCQKGAAFSVDHLDLAAAAMADGAPSVVSDELAAYAAELTDSLGGGSHGELGCVD